MLTMGEGNPGALAVLMQLLENPDFKESVHIILSMDDMNIRGSQIWVAFKDHCKQDLELLKKLVLARDKELIATVNKECPGAEKAVMGGASFKRG